MSWESPLITTTTISRAVVVTGCRWFHMLIHSDGSICPSTAYEVVHTPYMCSTLMCKQLWMGMEPQPLHNGMVCSPARLHPHPRPPISPPSTSLHRTQPLPGLHRGPSVLRPGLSQALGSHARHARTRAPPTAALWRRTWCRPPRSGGGGCLRWAEGRRWRRLCRHLSVVAMASLMMGEGTASSRVSQASPQTKASLDDDPGRQKY